jgi:hypothetical protein
MNESIGRVFVGFMIILIGVIFLLGSLDKLDVGYVFSNYWPMLLVFVGIWQLFAAGGRNPETGIILIIIGGLFMLSYWDILGVNAWKVIWPVVIIGVGLWILLKPRVFQRSPSGPGIREDDLGLFTMFSGLNRRIESQQFRGGRASVIFGGIDLDFTGAELAEGKATVELTAILGGMDVRVPRNWKVEVDGNAILGGVDDEHKSEIKEDNPQKLYIRATAILGGIDIRN